MPMFIFALSCKKVITKGTALRAVLHNIFNRKDSRSLLFLQDFYKEK